MEKIQDVTDVDRIRSWAKKSKAHGGTHRSSRRSDPNLLPISNPQTFSSAQSQPTVSTTSNNATLSSSTSGPGHGSGGNSAMSGVVPPDPGDGSSPPPAVSSQPQGQGPVLDGSTQKKPKKKPIAIRFLLTAKEILLHSWINVLLVFVPAGIAVGITAKISPGTPAPGVVFALNAIAIVPLAGLLSHATEMVAGRLGDALGALLNVTFGNAVELIIFIALQKNEIRIVQASTLGSILANLLLILGMAFCLGGLRYREQLYNSTVTQMSACLLSLSVISLVLPTAFHASFSDTNVADQQSLKISRGTSVILLLVYLIYLLFQLKSHAYMYESTPQHIIDEESTPGPVAGWLDSSTSDSSSSSDSDSDDSNHSRDTVSKRVRRVIRGGRRRKSSVASMDTNEAGPTRTPSFGTSTLGPGYDESHHDDMSARPSLFPKLTSLDGNEEAVEEEHQHRQKKRRHRHSIRRYRRSKKRSHASDLHEGAPDEETIAEDPEVAEKATPDSEPRRVDFAVSDVAANANNTTDTTPARRPFTALRGMSLRPVALSLTPTVFAQPPEVPVVPAYPTGPVPRIRYGIRRTNSLPDRLHQYQFPPPGAMMPSQIPLHALARGKDTTDPKENAANMSVATAVILLLISTGLVALCAEFMVDSITGLVATTSVGETFVGLIILPIVGNAAEHVTAITVAMKNKMDLAIGVAVGSSIQIALFITPLIVILGWIIDREMTLYFTLFETVCLFVSAFIVNFLVLDGRSNYLEGALLCATYVIISLVAFFYPNADQASTWGD